MCRSGSLRISPLWVLVLTSVCFAQTVDFAVPGGQLKSALDTYAKQAGIHLVYREDDVRGVKTEGVTGALSADDALERILVGTSLTIRRDASGAMAVVKNAPSGNALSGSAGELRLAQTESQSKPDAVPAQAAASETEPTGLQEIVVTAQKREERLQQVPISISVLNGESLDRSTVRSVRDALNTVPGVSMATNQNDSPQVTVRGVSAAAGRFGGSGVTGYYLDTIPFALVSNAIVPDSNVYDLERVEVLRGPQGTLYGASSLNGVVRVLTADANLEKFDLKGRALTSSTQDGDWNYRGDMAVNVPLIEGRLGARVVAGYQEMSGWIDRPNNDDANDQANSNVRFKLNAQVTEKLSLGLSAWRSRIDNGSTSVADDAGRSLALVDEPNSDDYDVYGFKAAYDFSEFSVVSATSYIDALVTTNLDGTPFGLPSILHTDLRSQAFAQEILATSTLQGSWRWSIGGIYRDARDRTEQQLPSLSTARTADRDETSESVAVYGEVTKALLDGRLELTGGMRYFKDDVGMVDRLVPLSPSDTFSNTSPRVVLTWLPSPDLTVYGSYAEGFRSGAQQPSTVVALGIPATRPDTLKNYEVGAKGRLLGGLLAFDAALYYIDWEDLQQPLLVIIQLAGLPAQHLAVVNGDAAGGLGFDLGLTAQPTDRLKLGASMSWNDLAFDSDVFSGTSLYAAKGDRLNNSPEFTFGLWGDYVFPVTQSGYEGRLSVAANHQARQLTRGNSGALANGDPITISRMSFSLQAPARWGATLFVDNLGNEQGKVLATPFGISYMHARSRPRTLGLQLDYRF